MKILYVINQISDWSGDSGLLWLSVKLMQKRGHDVTIATTDGNPFRDPSSYEKYSQITKKISTSLENPIIINETPIIPVHSISSHFGMYSINAKSIARKTVKFFDLVHIYSWYHHIGIEFFKAAKKYHIPVVFTAMGTLQSDAKNFNKTQKSIIDQLYTKKIIQYASVLHSVGTSEIKSYSQLGGDTKKIIQNTDVGDIVLATQWDNRNNTISARTINTVHNSKIVSIKPGRIAKKVKTSLNPIFSSWIQKLLSQKKQLPSFFSISLSLEGNGLQFFFFSRSKS